jgi:hypothetical protein
MSQLIFVTCSTILLNVLVAHVENRTLTITVITVISDDRRLPSYSYLSFLNLCPYDLYVVQTTPAEDTCEEIEIRKLIFYTNIKS